MNISNIGQEHFFWILESICGLHRRPYDRKQALQLFCPPYDDKLLLTAATEYGLRGAHRPCRPKALAGIKLPVIAWLKSDTDGAVPVLVLHADDEQVAYVGAKDAEPVRLPLATIAQSFMRRVTQFTLVDESAADPDATQRGFGFSWFSAELARHRRLWRDVLCASLVIQLIALATPLFTQTIIDKVVVHHTRSTLLVIVVAMVVFLIFSVALTWVRQALVLYIGNQVDAVLTSAVFERMFKLPPVYMHERPTGVVAARLQGVETIREFLAGAAVALLLDLPFLLIFAAVMFYYSVTLTLIVLGILVLIIALSLLAGPMFQSRLQRQFLLGARNQAFVTEYLVGFETVKSLQLEGQINGRYRGYMADYLDAAFSTRQLANSYNCAAQLLDQIMTLAILAVGAYTVMNNREFTIGMLVAFQMFASRLSQPMLRLVGMWQQFQQARLAVARLADVMDVPPEPYSALPARINGLGTSIDVERLGFRYAPGLPPVYENLDLSIGAGQTIAIVGPSGCGKSTLAKLMQGFYQPAAGRILLGGTDIRKLSANELRCHFGVVPQETVLFSGTIHDNLQMAAPEADFDAIVAACRIAEIHHDIEALPSGYQTRIGERGCGLSGGQRQRIAIARAVLRRAGILIFDEATSALDAATAEAFARTINKLRGRVTMLFITHALPRGLLVDAAFRLERNGAVRLNVQAATRSVVPSTLAEVATAPGDLDA